MTSKNVQAYLKRNLSEPLEASVQYDLRQLMIIMNFKEPYSVSNSKVNTSLN